MPNDRFKVYERGVIERCHVGSLEGRCDRRFRVKTRNLHVLARYLLIVLALLGLVLPQYVEAINAEIPFTGHLVAASGRSGLVLVETAQTEDHDGATDHGKGFWGGRESALGSFRKNWAFMNAIKYGWAGRELSLDVGLVHALDRLLTVQGSNVDKPFQDGFTPLTWAAVVGSAQLAKRLLDKGANPNLRLNDGSTAFMWATIFRRTEVVKLLRPLGARDTLAIAAMLGDESSVQRFISTGADVNTRDEYNRTALMEAAWGGNSETAIVLLQKGAEVNARDKYGRTALMEAIWGGKVEVARLLLDRAADADAINEFGMSALMEASWAGRLNTARLLLEKGADVNVKDKYGRTALTIAVQMGRADVVQLLLDKGADANARTVDGWPILMDAVISDRVDVLKLLLNKGVRLDPASHWGSMAAHLAGENNPEILELLKAYGAAK